MEALFARLICAKKHLGVNVLIIYLTFTFSITQDKPVYGTRMADL